MELGCEDIGIFILRMAVVKVGRGSGVTLAVRFCHDATHRMNFETLSIYQVLL